MHTTSQSNTAADMLSKTCENCGTTHSVLFRRGGIDDEQTLCNACALYFRSHGEHRPNDKPYVFRSRRSKKSKTNFSRTKSSQARQAAAAAIAAQAAAASASAKELKRQATQEQRKTKSLVFSQHQVPTLSPNSESRLKSQSYVAQSASVQPAQGLPMLSEMTVTGESCFYPTSIFDEQDSCLLDMLQAASSSSSSNSASSSTVSSPLAFQDGRSSFLDSGSSSLPQYQFEPFGTVCCNPAIDFMPIESSHEQGHFQYPTTMAARDTTRTFEDKIRELQEIIQRIRETGSAF